MNPITRREMFLSSASGDYDGELPDPVTREEYYLKQIAENSGGGGFTPTEEQLTAMNSGIDSEKVAQIATNAQNISGKQDTIDSSHKLNSDLVNDTNQNNKFVTSAEKTKIANALTEEVVVDKIEEGNMNPITSNAVSNIHKSIFTELEAKTVPGLTLSWRSDLSSLPGDNRAWRYGNICFMYIDMTVKGTYTGSSTWVALWDMPNNLLNDGEKFAMPYFLPMCFDSSGRVLTDVILGCYVDLEKNKTYDYHIHGTITLLVH